MKKIIFFILLAIPFIGFSQSVFDKLKQKVKDRIDQRTDEGMDKAIDKTEEKIKDEKKKPKEDKKEAKASVTASTGNLAETFKSYSRYDYIPGDEIVYAEDFLQDVVGEFPLKWVTNSRGETVTIQGMEGKWLRMFQNSMFLSPYFKNLPENFTAEFDLILNFFDKELNYVFPEINFTLLNEAAGDEKGRKFFNETSALSDLKIALGPAGEDNSTIYVRSAKSGDEIFSNPSKPLTKLGDNYGKPVHFAIWIQKERFRMWMNGDKIYDIPQAVPEKASFNRMAIQVASSNYDEEKVGYYISNIKFAHGTPDMRSKLITEGKLVTNGILFDVNSDKIKPESSGVLQEIGKVLKENASLKVKITGHTDNDGDDAKNLDLSKRRAASVKQALATQFGIDESRMQTDGKGEANPIADNATKEGKAKNRRVEFIKL